MKKLSILPAVCLVLALLIAGCAKGAPAAPTEPEDGEPILSGDAGNTPAEPAQGTPDKTVPEDAGTGDPADAAPSEGTGDVGDNNDNDNGGDAENTGNTGDTGNAVDAENTGSTGGSGSTGGAGTPNAQTPPSVSTSGGGARPSKNGALAVSGTRLVGSGGESVQLRGVSTHGLAWFPGYVNDECFREISEDWGANVVRLAMYTAEYGGYCSGGDREDLRDLVLRGVDYATRHDMYVIVDWHILSDGDPNTHKDEAIDFFTDISARLSDYDNVLYEICNEPNGGTSWSSIKSYALEVIPAIRGNDPDAVILVGTPNWSQYVGDAARDPITEYGNIMYTLHFYAATHRGSLRDAMTSALDAGLPIFCSEFGICDASGNGALDIPEADEWVSAMEKRGVSYVMWSLSNKAESASIISSSCQKTSGFSESDLTETGKWLIETLGGAAESGSGTEPDPAPIPEPSPEPEPKPEPKPEPEPAPPAGDGVTWRASLVNSWESGGAKFYQYSLTVTNSGAAAVTSWRIELEFTGDIALQSGWNGSYSASGAGLTITSLDYNGALSPGASTGDVGFIVSGGKLIE